eukprot:gene38314-46560_t
MSLFANYTSKSDCLVDLRSEERFYEDDEGPKLSRTSGFADSLGMYTTTFVAGSEKDRAALERAQRAAANRKESQVLSLLPMINEMCAQMNLSAAAKSRSSELFQQVLLQNVVRTRQKDCVAAACVYLACRSSGYPRLLDEVAHLTHTDLSTITKYQATIQRHLQEEAGAQDGASGTSVGRITPLDLVNRFCWKVGVAGSELHCVHSVVGSLMHFEVFDGLPPQYVVAVSIVWVRVLGQMRGGWAEEEGHVALQPVRLTREEVKQITSACFAAYETVHTMFKTMRPALQTFVPDFLKAVAGSRSVPTGFDQLGCAGVVKGPGKKREREGGETTTTEKDDKKPKKA